MDHLNIDDLLIRVDASAPERLRLDWLGSSDHATPGALIVPFFEGVLTEAARDGRFVDMHFEALQHFNSATIATLLRLVYSAKKAQVSLRIHYDGTLRWQALSFEALEQVVSSYLNRGRATVEFSSLRS